MRILTRLFLCAAGIMTVPALAAAQTPTPVVAAENFYGDIARQLGADRVRVTSIISNPDSDPHLFEISPSIARSLGQADIIIQNGAGYDEWMKKLVRSASHPGQRRIVADSLQTTPHDDNPHLWYDTALMRRLSAALSQELIRRQPARKAFFEHKHQEFAAALDRIDATIARLRPRTTGLGVAMSEPVFGRMADALKMHVYEKDFQRAIMNETEPSAVMLSTFERDIKSGKIKLFIYNKQVRSPMTDRLMRLAAQQHIPLVGVTETLPPGQSYQEWMLNQLSDIERHLTP